MLMHPVSLKNMKEKAFGLMIFERDGNQALIFRSGKDSNCHFTVIHSNLQCPNQVGSPVPGSASKRENEHAYMQSKEDWIHVHYITYPEHLYE